VNELAAQAKQSKAGWGGVKRQLGLSSRASHDEMHQALLTAAADHFEATVSDVVVEKGQYTYSP